MIINNQIVYTVPVSNPKEGETAAHRHPIAVNGFKYLPDPNTYTIQDVIEQGVRKYGPRDFIGSYDRKAGKYVYKTYQEIYDLGLAIGSGLINLGLTNHVEEFENHKLDVIGKNYFSLLGSLGTFFILFFTLLYYRHLQFKPRRMDNM